MRAILSAAAIAALCLATTTPASAQLVRDEEIERLLRDYTTPLLEAANLNAADTHFYIVDDASLNAMVSGGQNIFVNTGTFLTLDTPNQLKGILAHEIGHIAGGHLSRLRGAQTAAIGTMLATMGIGVLAAVAGAADAGAMVFAGAPQMGAASMAAFTYVQEAAADEAGVTYMEQTGQSSRGLLESFDMLRRQEILRDRRTGSFYGDFFRNHPTSADRISSLRQRVEASPFADRTDTPEDLFTFSMIQAKIYGFMDAPTRVLRRYRTDDVSQPARYARSVAYFRLADVPKGLAEIDSLIAEEPDNPYFRELKGQMLFESGRAEESLEPYREATRLLPDSGLLHAGLGQALVATRKPEHQEEAINELKLATALDKDIPMAWYQLSQIYDRMGERAMAELAVAEQSYTMGDMNRAREFARRARDELEYGSMDWRRATDILSASQLDDDDRRGSRLTFDPTVGLGGR